MTGESAYGELKGGLLITDLSQSYCKLLLEPKHGLLDTIANMPLILGNGSTSSSDKLPFEITVGVNGVVWINSFNDLCLVFISNVIRNGEGLGAKERDAMVKEVFKSMSKIV